MIEEKDHRDDLKDMQEEEDITYSSLDDDKREILQDEIQAWIEEVGEDLFMVAATKWLNRTCSVTGKVNGIFIDSEAGKKEKKK